MEKVWVVSSLNPWEKTWAMLDVEGVFETLEDAIEKAVGICEDYACNYLEWGDEVKEKVESSEWYEKTDDAHKLEYFEDLMEREPCRVQVEISETAIFKKGKGNGTTQ
jgi:hypothetical protein